MALCEMAAGDEGASQDARTEYGFAFLDAAAGRYYVGCASDDAGRANIGAILAQVMSLCILGSSKTCRVRWVARHCTLCKYMCF